MRQLCALAATDDVARLRLALDDPTECATAARDFGILMRQPAGYWGDHSLLLREVCEVFEPDLAISVSLQLESPEHYVMSACMLNAVCAGAIQVIQFLNLRHPYFWSESFTRTEFRCTGMLSEACSFASEYQYLEAPIRGIEELLKPATDADLQVTLEETFAGSSQQNSNNLRSEIPRGAMVVAIWGGHKRLQEVVGCASLGLAPRPTSMSRWGGKLVTGRSGAPQGRGARVRQGRRSVCAAGWYWQSDWMPHREGDVKLAWAHSGRRGKGLKDAKGPRRVV
jgi:hypothetical protein